MATTGQQGAIGVVSATKGEVFAKGADGQMRRLAVGDNVFEGDVIVTANGSTADITPFNGPVLHVQEQQTVAIDAQVAAPAHDTTAGAIAPLGSTEAATVIQNVAPQAGQDFNTTLADEATAAGLAGGDGNQGGRSFVDLMRIIENVPQVGYDFPINPTGTTPIITGTSGSTPTTPTTETTPPADSVPLANNDYSGIAHTDRAGAGAHGNVLWNDIAGTPIHVTSVDGTPVLAGQTTTIAGLYGTLTIAADGTYSYASTGPFVANPAHDNVTMRGTSMFEGGEFFDPSYFPAGGVASVPDSPRGYGVRSGSDLDQTPSIDRGESLIFSFNHPVNSVTISLGQIHDAAVARDAHWYAYDSEGVQLGTGDFASSFDSVTHTMAPREIDFEGEAEHLVISNFNRSEGDTAPSFDVTSVMYSGFDAFRYTIADSNGSESSAWLLLTPDAGNTYIDSDGNLLMIGTAANNVLDSDRWSLGGNDLLSGGAGNDVLTGGVGVDTFVWHLADAAGTSSLHPAHDTITDFSAGDVLELNDLITSRATVDVKVSGGNTTVTVTADATHVQQIVLEGYAADITAMTNQLKSPTHSFTG